MASNSKKRRRVLGVSCILAALIIASSSFAWFTSKDEVTNRLTANSDYGVSIVESFTPPENLLPGQEVNKDVYAVNTGNIDAFVKENIKGVLNYTYESKVNTWDKDCVKLTLEQAAAIEGATTEDGFKTMEAGGYLAWTDTSLATGPLYSGRTQDLETPWYPTETGVYIFRRSIGGTNDNPTFTYAGYYFVKGSAAVGTEGEEGYQPATDDAYYKIVIGKDAFRYNTGTTYQFDVAVPDTALRDGTGAALTVGTEENDDIDPDTGVINSETLKVSYVKETEVEDEGVTFTYEAASGDRTYDRLKVEYTAVATDDGTYDASAAAARAEIDYANAKKASDQADDWYTQAKAEFDYATTLAKQTNALYEKADAAKLADTALTSANNAKVAALSAVTAAAGTLNTGIGNMITAATTTNSSAINPTNSNFVPQNVLDLVNAANASTDYPYVYQNYQQLQSLYDEMFSTTAGSEGYATLAKNAAATLATYVEDTDDSTYDPDIVQGYVDTIRNNLNKLNETLDKYYLKYANLIDQVESDTTITVDTSDYDTQKAKINTVKTTVGGLITSGTTLNGLSGTYKTKFDEWVAARTANTTALNEWNSQVTAYNTAVDAARTTYKAAVAAGTNETADDHGASLVADYSANATGVDPTGTDTTNTDYPTIGDPSNFDDYDAQTAKVLPETSTFEVALTETTDTSTPTTTVVNKTVDGWKELKTTNNNTAAIAKAAYDDAVDALRSGSTITLYVNLADDYATYWQIDPDDQPSSTDVDFYLKKILAAGETSHKLVDSITFADSVTANDYKNLTFDLNVGLDSAQITYADDQRTITTDAVVAPFAMTPQVTQADRTVAWS
jgi:alternate signal-mediated exported protein